MGVGRSSDFSEQRVEVLSNQESEDGKHTDTAVCDLGLSESHLELKGAVSPSNSGASNRLDIPFKFALSD
jgi:hypothetical protein